MGTQGARRGFRVHPRRPSGRRAQASGFPTAQPGGEGSRAGRRRPHYSGIGGDRALPRRQISGEGLLPPDLRQRAQAYRWIMFAVTELEQPLWRISKHTALYPEDKRLQADIALAREEFLAMAAVLDSHLEGRRFIVGDSITAADCITAYLIDWANELQLIDNFAQLRDYLERMYARPAAPQRIAEAFRELRAA